MPDLVTRPGHRPTARERRRAAQTHAAHRASPWQRSARCLQVAALRTGDTRAMLGAQLLVLLTAGSTWAGTGSLLAAAVAAAVVELATPALYNGVVDTRNRHLQALAATPLPPDFRPHPDASPGAALLAAARQQATGLEPVARDTADAGIDALLWDLAEAYRVDAALQSQAARGRPEPGEDSAASARSTSQQAIARLEAAARDLADAIDAAAREQAAPHGDTGGIPLAYRQ